MPGVALHAGGPSPHDPLDRPPLDSVLAAFGLTPPGNSRIRPAYDAGPQAGSNLAAHHAGSAQLGSVSACPGAVSVLPRIWGVVLFLRALLLRRGNAILRR